MYGVSCCASAVHALSASKSPSKGGDGFGLQVEIQVEGVDGVEVTEAGCKVRSAHSL